MTPSLTYGQLIALNPCEERLPYITERLGGRDTWRDTPVTAAQARAAGATYDDVFWAASHLAGTDQDVARRLRLWAADCAARVLHAFERSQPYDARPRKAIVAARAYARGWTNDAARASARAAAWDAAGAASWAWDAAAAASWAAATGPRGSAAGAAAGAAARAVARATASDTAGAAAGAAARAGGWAAAGDAAGAAERAWQFDQLIARLSDPEPDDVPLPNVAGRSGGV